tara:strand:- start:1034 stop:1336 length:303 start_codon:yes stop_codon:yes gene_type:complete
MTQLQINNVTGVTLPYDIFICDIYGNQCILVATINVAIPPTITITLPIEFNMAPAIGIKIITPDCEKFLILNCNELTPIEKQFQDGDDFFFMDYSIYQFQ